MLKNILMSIMILKIKTQKRKPRHTYLNRKNHKNKLKNYNQQLEDIKRKKEDMKKKIN